MNHSFMFKTEKEVFHNRHKAKLISDKAPSYVFTDITIKFENALYCAREGSGILKSYTVFLSE